MSLSSHSNGKPSRSSRHSELSSGHRPSRLGSDRRQRKDGSSRDCTKSYSSGSEASADLLSAPQGIEDSQDTLSAAMLALNLSNAKLDLKQLAIVGLVAMLDNTAEEAGVPGSLLRTQAINYSEELFT